MMNRKKNTKRKNIIFEENKLSLLVQDTWKCIFVFLFVKDAARFYSTGTLAKNIVNHVFPSMLPHSHNTRKIEITSTWIDEFKKFQFRSLLTNPEALLNFVMKHKISIIKPYTIPVFLLFLNKFKEFTDPSLNPTVLSSSLKVSITNPIFLFRMRNLPHGNCPLYVVANNIIWLKTRETWNFNHYSEEFDKFNIKESPYAVQRVCWRSFMYTIDSKSKTLVVHSPDTTGYYRETDERKIKRKLSKLKSLSFTIYSGQHMEDIYSDLKGGGNEIVCIPRFFSIEKATLKNAKSAIEIPHVTLDELKFVKEIPRPDDNEKYE